MKGVSYDTRSDKYRAYINFGGNRVYLGWFASRGDAETKRTALLQVKSQGLIPCLNALGLHTADVNDEYLLRLGANCLKTKALFPLSLAIKERRGEIKFSGDKLSSDALSEPIFSDWTQRCLSLRQIERLRQIPKGSAKNILIQYIIPPT